MTPQIDTNAINDRTDWRHDLVEDPAPVAVTRMPGIAARFATQDVDPPPLIALTGFLEGTHASVVADANNALDAALKAIWAKRDGNVHKITINGTDYDNCVLVSARFFGPVRSVVTTGRKVRRAVRIVWRQLLA